MARISQKDVEHIAELCRIKLEKEEMAKFTSQLGAVLNYIAELEKAPTKNVQEIFFQIADLKNVARPDQIRESLPVERVLENAPQKENSFIKTRQVFE